VTLNHINPMFSLSLSSIRIDLHTLIQLPKPHTLGFGLSCSNCVCLLISML
jgi:hypothetical protein